MLPDTLFTIIFPENLVGTMFKNKSSLLLRNNSSLLLRNKFLLVCFILLISLFYFFSVVFSTNYEPLLTRISAMDRCFKDSQIPCRWIPGQENFYGSPLFNYLPPLPYYFGELVFSITKSLTASVRVLLLLSLVGSYFFTYLLIKKKLGIFKANLAAIFYMSFAFLVILYSSEKVGLVWGLMFFPLVILSLNLLSQKKNIQNFLSSAISLSLLMLSVDIVIFFVGITTLWIFYKYIRTKDFTFFILGLSSIFLAFLLSAFYIFPSILERNLIYSTSLNDPFRFLPRSATERPQKITTSQYQILTGDSDVFNFSQGTNWLGFETDTRTHTIIRLSEFYFPHWKIFIDGKETQVEYKNNSLGLMTIILGEGKHRIEGRLFDTPIRSISNLVTIVSVILTCVLWIIQLRGVRYWLNYYRKRIN